jgi:hypothetical protein
MTTNKKIYVIPFILFITMACAFVQNMVFPPSPTAAPPSPQLSNPTAISTISTEISAPTSESINNPEPIACTSDDCLNACLDRLDQVLETRPFAPIGNSIYEEQGANFDLVIYKVEGDEIIEPTILYVPSEYRKYQDDTASHLRIWKFYVAIIPSELRKLVNEFVIFTDGPSGDAGAWVRPSSTNPDDWQVGFDLLDSDYPLFVADALVHETGHLLTLNTLQIPEDEDHYYFYDSRTNNVLGCSQYAVYGKCSLPNSYINLFYQRFWKDVYKEWWETDQKAQDTKTFEEYLNVMEQFYDDHSELFIDSYAATNVEEDMAESFSFFVLNPQPSGNSVSEQKVAFFYEFPELVEYRQQIIEGLCSYVR